MLTKELESSPIEKGLAPDQAIFLAKQKKKKPQAPKPKVQPKQKKK